LRILDGLNALPDREAGLGCVATVGVFDGVHLGHFKVLRKVVERAVALDTRPVMVTFAGHPKSVLLGQAPPAVTSLEHRLLLFERAGIQTTLVLKFTPELKQLSAEDFVRTVLMDGMGLRELVFGFDSKFGRDRGGNPQSLRPLAKEWGFAIAEVPPVRLSGRVVSSTVIREAVQCGDLVRASSMLGRPVSLLGTVVEGDQRGRRLGFPTANLRLHHEMRPPSGVYAALVLKQEQLLPAVVNIGSRPTFGGDDLQIEAHLLDFKGNLYGQALEVFLLERLRAEKTFDDQAALIQQIKADVASGRKVLDAAPDHWRMPGLFLPIEGPSPEDLVDRGPRC
jgi:riboflavin kinase / FMN adenylyltransferase